jgi:hypothetical protein
VDSNRFATERNLLMMIKSLAHQVASALLLGATLVVAPFGTAQAARSRPIVVQPRIPNPTPSTPEPAAAIVFGLGVALVAWRSRRARPPK